MRVSGLMLKTWGANVSGEFASFNEADSARAKEAGAFEELARFDELTHRFDSTTMKAVPLSADDVIAESQSTGDAPEDRVGFLTERVVQLEQQIDDKTAHNAQLEERVAKLEADLAKTTPTEAKAENPAAAPESVTAPQ